MRVLLMVMLMMGVGVCSSAFAEQEDSSCVKMIEDIGNLYLQWQHEVFDHTDGGFLLSGKCPISPHEGLFQGAGSFRREIVRVPSDLYNPSDLYKSEFNSAMRSKYCGLEFRIMAQTQQYIDDCGDGFGGHVTITCDFGHYLFRDRCYAHGKTLRDLRNQISFHSSDNLNWSSDIEPTLKRWIALNKYKNLDINALLKALLDLKGD